MLAIEWQLSANREQQIGHAKHFFAGLTPIAFLAHALARHLFWS